jgi:hypothetical protein
MDEVSAKQLRQAGMKEPPPCPVCGKREWKYLRHYGSPPLQTIFVMATCENCRGVQMLWRSNMKAVWMRFEQAGGVV